MGWRSCHDIGATRCVVSYEPGYGADDSRIVSRVCEAEAPECHDSFAALSEIVRAVQDTFVVDEMHPVVFNHTLYAVCRYTRDVIPEARFSFMVGIRGGETPA